MTVIFERSQPASSATEVRCTFTLERGHLPLPVGSDIFVRVRAPTEVSVDLLAGESGIHGHLTFSPDVEAHEKSSRGNFAFETVAAIDVCPDTSTIWSRRHTLGLFHSSLGPTVLPNVAWGEQDKIAFFRALEERSLGRLFAPGNFSLAVVHTPRAGPGERHQPLRFDVQGTSTPGDRSRPVTFALHAGVGSFLGILVELTGKIEAQWLAATAHHLGSAGGAVPKSGAEPAAHELVLRANPLRLTVTSARGGQRAWLPVHGCPELFGHIEAGISATMHGDMHWDFGGDAMLSRQPAGLQVTLDVRGSCPSRSRRLPPGAWGVGVEKLKTTLRMAEAAEDSPIGHHRIVGLSVSLEDLHTAWVLSSHHDPMRIGGDGVILVRGLPHTSSEATMRWDGLGPPQLTRLSMHGILSSGPRPLHIDSPHGAADVTLERADVRVRWSQADGLTTDLDKLSMSARCRGRVGSTPPLFSDLRLTQLPSKGFRLAWELEGHMARLRSLTGHFAANVGVQSPRWTISSPATCRGAARRADFCVHVDAHPKDSSASVVDVEISLRGLRAYQITAESAPALVPGLPEGLALNVTPVGATDGPQTRWVGSLFTGEARPQVRCHHIDMGHMKVVQAAPRADIFAADGHLLGSLDGLTLEVHRVRVAAPAHAQRPHWRVQAGSLNVERAHGRLRPGSCSGLGAIKVGPGDLLWEARGRDRLPAVAMHFSEGSTCASHAAVQGHSSGSVTLRSAGAEPCLGAESETFRYQIGAGSGRVAWQDASFFWAPGAPPAIDAVANVSWRARLQAVYLGPVDRSMRSIDLYRREHEQAGLSRRHKALHFSAHL